MQQNNIFANKSEHVASEWLMCNRVHCNVMSRVYKVDEITRLDIASVIISAF